MAFQLEETRCELLDQDRSLNPEDFHEVQGYKYFDVEQALNRNVSKIVNYIQSSYLESFAFTFAMVRPLE